VPVAAVYSLIRREKTLIISTSRRATSAKQLESDENN